MAWDRVKYQQEHREHIAKSRREYNQKHKKEIAEYCYNRYKEIANWYYNNIKELCCLDCNLSFRDKVYMADFHHLYGRDTQSGMLGLITHCSYNRVVEELNDGVFICPNCHRERHPERWRRLCQ